jgi:hypothetical protein
MVLECADPVRPTLGRDDAEAMLSEPRVKPTPNIDVNAKRATNFFSNFFMDKLPWRMRGSKVTLAECGMSRSTTPTRQPFGVPSKSRS